MYQKTGLRTFELCLAEQYASKNGTKRCGNQRNFSHVRVIDFFKVKKNVVLKSIILCTYHSFGFSIKKKISNSRPVFI